MRAIVGFIPLILTTVITHCHGGIYDWQEKPYGNDDFNIRVKFMENITLQCNDTRISTTYTFKYWIRPDLEIMLAGASDFFRTRIDGDAGWVVDSTTHEMHIYNIHGNHFGFYYCVIELSTGNDMVIKKGVNYKGPYFGDIWPEYEMNVIIGCSAAGGLIVIIIVIYLIDKFYYSPDKHNSTSGSLELSTPGISSITDQGFSEGPNEMYDMEDNAIKQIFAHQQNNQEASNF